MRWLMLPGMGATAAMYNGLKQELEFRINYLDWPEYRGEKTYAEIARRIVRENAVSSDDVVGGSSLGGMVALEIAQMADVKAVVLIGSAVSRNDVQVLLALLSPLAAAAPITIIQALVGKHRSLVNTMFADSDPEFIRAMCAYLPSWNGYQGAMDRLFRLHGKKDHVIPCPPTGCDVVETAGHLVAITHSKETAEFLNNVRKRLPSN